jgi:putative endonuclease
MKCVYSLQSTKQPGRYYIGITDDLKQRISDHNSGKCTYTAALSPWQLEGAFLFVDDQKAHSFERYLKTGSGRAFMKRHFS